jgi:AGZA family xanthine/uracil permease-like MFS transporter
LNAIPVDLRRAIGVGIGFFIAFIGLVNARLVIVPSGTIAGMTSDPSSVLPPVTFGSLREPEAIVAFIGLVVIGVLMARRIPGAILLGIAASTVAALILGVGSLPAAIFETPSFETFGAADMSKALTVAAIPLLISVMMVDFFDTMGTATAVMDEAGLEDENGRIPRLRELLAVDSLGAIIGGVFGVSSTTAYVESAAGVAEGARTGMHNIVVGLLFLAAIFIAPVFAIVPGAATAPALIVVGFLMCGGITRIDFRTVASGLPAFILMLMVPMTYSIAHGIGYGFTSYVLISLFTGRGRDVHPLMYGTAAVFVAYFIFG